MSENRPFADVLPSRASAVWTVPFARDSWERLSTAAEPFKTFVAAFIASFTEGRAERVAIGPVLTDAPHPATAIFYAEHPTDSTSRDEVLCAVSISPRPTDDLPGELVVASHALKGWRGLASVVKDVCSSTEVPPVAMYVLDFKLDTGHWRCLLVPRPVGADAQDGPVLLLGKGAVVRRVGYRIIDGVSGLQQVDIEVSDRPEKLGIHIVSRSLLSIGEALELPHVEELRDLVLGRLLLASPKEAP